MDLGGNQVTELSEQSGEVWKHSNVFSAARLAATYDYNGGNGGLHYALADPLGTKRIQANISGQIEESCVSLPFGDALSCTPTALPTADDATEHHFTQKERDNESGNDYFFARYYNSALGRFTTPDWSAKEEPVPYAAFTDPQSLNLYAYVRNNPITRVDADGHEEPWCLCQVIENIQNIKLPTKQDFQVGAIVVATVGVMVLHNLNPLNAFHKDAPTPAATPAPAPTTGTTPLPTGLVGTDPRPTKGRTNSGPLAPDNGGSGDAGKDFGTLTGGKSGPAAPGSTLPPGTQVGENGIQLRPATGTAGPRIDIPVNGSKPRETLHYPPPPPPPPPTQPKP